MIKIDDSSRINLFYLKKANINKVDLIIDLIIS